MAAPESLDLVLSAYAQSRVERPDGNLLARARLAAEMTPMRVLLHALAWGALDLVEDAAASLRALDERVVMEDELRAVEADREDWESVEILSNPSAPELLPEPDWDATQPHQPFPDPSVTQAIDPTPAASPAGGPDVESEGSGEERAGADAVEPNDGRAG